MRIGLTVIFGLVIGACALWGSGLASQPAEAAAPSAPSAGGVVGIGTPGSCTPSALHTRLAGGGLVTFNCGAAPVTIVVSPTEVISLNTTIQGGGVITLSGGLAGPILDIEGGLVTLADLTLADGYNEGGGAVYNNEIGRAHV